MPLHRRLVPAVKASLARPAVFGSFDGTSSLLGVLVYLLVTHPKLIFPTALCGAISSAVSMGGGEWLSDSSNGFGASMVMGGATFAGAVLPAAPFAFGGGWLAITASAVIIVAIHVAVAFLRPNRSRWLALTETFGLFAVNMATILVCGLFLFPGTAT
jgi:hypothetical protein